MKLWVDDIREMPKMFDVHAKTLHEAVSYLVTGLVTEISLDHDLGDESTCGNGYRIAIWIEHAAYRNEIPRLKWYLHTANPIGRMKMSSALKKADIYWEENENGC